MSANVKKMDERMVLIRLSGHSGAGKSRLTAAVAKIGFVFRRAVIYTSRPPRAGEVHGRDYYFMSRSFIQGLPKDRFLVGDVRHMIQAVDLVQLELDLRSGEPVIVEIFHTRWPPLRGWLLEHFGAELKLVSVFLNAVPSAGLADLPKPAAEAYIREEIRRVLTWRAKDRPKAIAERAESAVTEVLQALTVRGLYDRVIQSAPEGPDGEDEWTRAPKPEGFAASALQEFKELVQKALCGLE